MSGFYPADRQYRGTATNSVDTVAGATGLVVSDVDKEPGPPGNIDGKPRAGSGPAIFAKSKEESKEAALKLVSRSIDKIASYNKTPGKVARKPQVVKKASLKLVNRAIEKIAAPAFNAGTFDPNDGLDFTLDPAIAAKAAKAHAARQHLGEIGQSGMINELEGQGYQFSGWDKGMAKVRDFTSSPKFTKFAPLLMNMPYGHDQHGNRRTLGDTALGRIVTYGLPLLSMFGGGLGVSDAGKITGLSKRHLPKTPPPPPPVP